MEKHLLNALLVFIRRPEPGKVKTRLAKTLGDDKALEIYRFLLEKTRSAALEVPAQRWLFYTDIVDETDEWAAEKFVKKTQAAGDLGQRLEAAFQEVFDNGAQKAVVVGSDCPEISAEIIHQAFLWLDAYPCVLGPTPDGGYYLLGLRAPAPQLFRGITWSTEVVRAQTLEAAQTSGLEVGLLPPLSDIDTEEDWQDYLKRAITD